MKELLRKSAVDFPFQIKEHEQRDGWRVVLQYEDEGDGPHLVDLSHVRKWDVQDRDLDRHRPWGRTIPTAPSESILDDGLLINRMNRTQASIWRLSGPALTAPESKSYTEITDGQCLLAVTGSGAVSVMEKVCALDLFAPGFLRPRLIQGPVLHLPCQIVVLEHSGPQATILMAFPRSYGADMARALLDSASDLGLRPGGERVFQRRVLLSDHVVAFAAPSIISTS